MAYYKYKCKKCENSWEGRKLGTKCPKCGSEKFERNMNKTRYDVLDDAAERYAKQEEIRNKKGKL